MATQISNNNSISSNMNNFERVLPTMPVIVKSPKISATAETSSTSSPPASSTSFPTTDSTDIITSTTRTTTSTAISPTIKSISNNNNKRKNLINPREKGNEDDGGKTIKKIKRVKDPNAPKRPANAYIQFPYLELRDIAISKYKEEINTYNLKQEDTIKLPTNEYELQDDNSKSIKRLIKNAQHAQTTDELLLAHNGIDYIDDEFTLESLIDNNPDFYNKQSDGFTINHQYQYQINNGNNNDDASVMFSPTILSNGQSPVIINNKDFNEENY
ncbi:15479_t:CDS:2 [Entrophospora sp. SA101]|nr:15479_t:CDS:2 [Entrophospora sp. SA101]